MPMGAVERTSQEQVLSFDEIVRVLKSCVSGGIRDTKITGGEPLVRRGCVSFLRNLKSIPGVEQVTITTNGVFLKDCLSELEDIGIDGINISLDTLNPETYEKMTRRNEFSRVWNQSLHHRIQRFLQKLIVFF